MAYNQMPKHTEVDKYIKLQYINGYFCYARKIVVMSNALGILRHMDFCDNSPESMVPEGNPKLTASSDNSPEEVKLRWDGKLMIPSMDNFFSRHPDFSIFALAADAGFDDAPNYKYLFKDHNIFPIIDLNPRNAKDGFGIPSINEDGIPTCPNDPTLTMKWDSPCNGKSSLIFDISSNKLFQGLSFHYNLIVYILGIA